MKSEEKIIELLAEMVKNQDITNQRLESLEKTTEKRFEKLEKQVAKLTSQTQENTRAITRLADKMDDFAEHESRIRKLETAVFKS